jgi:hypothetical protein
MIDLLIRVPEWNPRHIAMGVRYSIFSTADLARGDKLAAGYLEALMASLESGTARIIPPSEARYGKAS